MTCGMHIPAEPGVFPKCETCNVPTILAIVTDENYDKLPFPTNPVGREIDFNDPSKTCQCRTGRCPCGKYVAHAIAEPCNAHDPE